MVPGTVARFAPRPQRPFAANRGIRHQRISFGRCACPSYGSLKTEEKTERQCGQ